MSWINAFRVALLAYPASFRRRWGPAMVDAFRDGLVDARARGHASRFALMELQTAVVTGINERLHLDTRQLRMLHLGDIRYALRLLTRAPGFALLTILVLAGGVGLSTFTVSFLYTAMYKPLPLGEGERIVRLMRTEDDRAGSADAYDIAQLRRSLRTVTELAPYTDANVVLGDAEASEKLREVDAIAADPMIFTVARTPAALGRTLLAADSDPGAEPVIVLSHREWELSFASSRGVLDSLVTVNGTRTRIVGVMPKGFGFPVAGEAWLPLTSAELNPTSPERATYQLLGRLAPGVSADEATAEASAQIQRVLAARDTTNTPGQSPVTMVAMSFPAAQFGPERDLVFGVLVLAALLILLLAIVNVTNLLVARANERTRETAVRLALGATTPRLVMQGMWESVLLCVGGGVVGTAAAAWGLRAITQWTQQNMQGNLAFWWVWQVDGVTFAVAGLFVSVAIGVLGAIVTTRATRTNVREVMQDGSARSGSRREGRVARGLVVTQITVVTLLMFFGVMSAVMAQRFVNMDVGFDASRLFQVVVDPPIERYETPVARQTVLTRVASAMAEQGEIQEALLRARMGSPGDEAQLVSRDNAGRSTRWPAHVFAAHGALTATGVVVVEGRAFTPTDDQAQERVAIVSQSLAKKQWPAQSPLGAQLRLAVGDDTVSWHTVVGVARDVPYGDPWARDRTSDAAYVPLLQTNVGSAIAFVRYRANEAAGRDAIYRAHTAVDARLVPGQVTSYRAVIEQSRMVTVGVAKLFGAAFAFALLLAVVGSYGLMARMIGLRTREIGVRRALGASDEVVTRLLLVSGARQLGVGAVIAFPLVALVGMAFNHFLPVGLWPTAIAAVAVPTAIVGVVLLTTWVPTRRVLQVAPRDALWRE